ncbi:MAG: hypothetical protein ACYDIA_20480 [Candidatus Humimicrobiaceae bacterium]
MSLKGFFFIPKCPILSFLIEVIVFGSWQVAKLIKPKFFYPVDDEAKKNITKLIVIINGVVAVLSAILIIAVGINNILFEVIGIFGTVFSSGSSYDLLKVYGAIK